MFLCIKMLQSIYNKILAKYREKIPKTSNSLQKKAFPEQSGYPNPEHSGRFATRIQLFNIREGKRRAVTHRSIDKYL